MVSNSLILIFLSLAYFSAKTYSNTINNPPHLKIITSQKIYINEEQNFCLQIFNILNDHSNCRIRLFVSKEKSESGRNGENGENDLYFDYNYASYRNDYEISNNVEFEEVYVGDLFNLQGTITSSLSPITVKCINVNIDESTFLHENTQLLSNQYLTKLFKFKLTCSSSTLDLSATHPLNILNSPIQLFIQTDKPIYLPGQKIFYKFLILDRFLKSVSRAKIEEISIFNPKGTKLLKISNTESRNLAFDDFGAYKNEFQISDEPVLGEWRIEVKLASSVASSSSSNYQTSFTVDKYTLPKFDVKISQNKDEITENDRFIEYQVCGVYTHGAVFKGEVEYEVEVEEGNCFWPGGPGQIFRSKRSSSVNKITDTAKISSNNGCIDLEIDISDLTFDYFNPNRNTKSWWCWSQPEIKFTATISEQNTNEKSLDFLAAKIVIDDKYFEDPNSLPSEGEPDPKVIFKCDESSTNFVQFKNFNFLDDQNFINVLYSGKSIFHSKIDQNGNLLVQNSFSSELNNLNQFKNSIYKVLVYSLSTSEDDSFRFQKLFFSQPTLDQSCKEELTLNIPSATLPGSKIDISFSGLQPSQTSGQTTKCNLALTDNSVQIYSESKNLKNNDITKKIIDDFLEKVDNFGYYKNCRDYKYDEFFDISGMAVFDSNKTYSCSWYSQVSDGYFGDSLDIVDRYDDDIVLLAMDVGLSDASSSESILRENSNTNTKPSKPQPIKIRNFMPETWIFNDFTPTSSNLNSITVPDTLTTWTAKSYCYSPNFPIYILPEKTIFVGKQFYTEIILPYSAVRGEIVEFPVQVFNNFDVDLVGVELEMVFLDEDFELQGQPGQDLNQKLLRTFNIRKNNNHVEKFKLLIKGLQEPTITVKANTADASSTDAMEKTIILKPEGIPKEYTVSHFVCNDDQTTTTKVKLADSPPIEDINKGNVISDSIRTRIQIIDDLLGPALENLDHLVDIPTGCGEQNMIGLVPNIAVANYLSMSNVNEKHENLKNEAIQNAKTGYFRQLKYQHNDGSFSAFGQKEQRDQGSSWLTAFVLKSFAEAFDHLEPFLDINLAINKPIQYLINNFETIGGNKFFKMSGQLFHQFFEDDIDGDGKDWEDFQMTVTAVAALERAKSQVDLSLQRDLENKISNVLDIIWTEYFPSFNMTKVPNYLLGQLLYLTSENLANKNDLHTEISKIIVPQGLYEKSSGGLYWESRPSSVIDSCNEETTTNFWSCHYRSSSNVELTSYILLSILNKDPNKDFEIVKYLQSKRSKFGGWSNTQNTMMAMTALTEYASIYVSKNGGIDMEIRIDTNDQDSGPGSSSGPTQKIIKIDENNSGYVRQIDLKNGVVLTNPNKEVSISGQGCLLIQSSTKYNQEKLEEDLSFILKYDKSRSNYCVRRLDTKPKTGMAIIEIEHSTGYVFDEESFESSDSKFVRRYENDENSLKIYVDSIDDQEKCIQVKTIKQAGVEVKNRQKRSLSVRSYYDEKANRNLMIESEDHVGNSEYRSEESSSGSNSSRLIFSSFLFCLYLLFSFV